MAITIDSTTMTSNIATTVATLGADGRWRLVRYPDDERFLYRSFTRNQAITAMTLAEVLATKPPPGDDIWAAVESWRRELNTNNCSCLYCGSTDISETRVTIDDRTDEYALQCDDCGGTWAQ